MENIKIIIQSISQLFQPVFDKIGEIFSAISNFIAALFDAFIKSPFYNSEFVQENAFNFVLVALLVIYIWKKAKITAKLTSAQEKIKESIEKSKQTREDSIEFLLQANEKVKNTKNEIAEIESNCEQNITNMQQRIEKETVSQIKGIEENTKRVIESENKQAVSKLSKKTAVIAIELAKKHIIEVLQKKPEYHQKFINESIQELDTGIK